MPVQYEAVDYDPFIPQEQESLAFEPVDYDPFVGQPELDKETPSLALEPVEYDPFKEQGSTRASEPLVPVGDYVRNFAVGVQGLGATAGHVLEQMGAEDAGGALKQYFQARQEATRGEMSPQVAQVQKTPFLSTDGGKDVGDMPEEVPLSDVDFNWQKIGLGAAESLSGTAAGMALGGVFGRALSPVLGRAASALGFGEKGVSTASRLGLGAGYGAGEAGVSSASQHQQVYDTVMQAPEDKLKASPEFYDYIAATPDDLDVAARVTQARVMMAEDFARQAALTTGAATFALSTPFGATVLDPMESSLKKALFGDKSIGFLKRQGLRAGAEGAQETPQSAAEQVSQNLAESRLDPSIPWDRDVKESAITGGITGALMGGAMPGGGGTRPATSADQTTDTTVDPLAQAYQQTIFDLKANGLDDLAAKIENGPADGSGPGPAGGTPDLSHLTPEERATFDSFAKTNGIGRLDVNIPAAPEAPAMPTFEAVDHLRGHHLEKLDPTLATNLDALAREFYEQTGRKLRISDGFRTFEQQADVYRRKPNLAAKPGTSRHEVGQAVDIHPEDAAYLISSGLGQKHGMDYLKGRTKTETWHWQMANTYGTPYPSRQQGQEQDSPSAAGLDTGKAVDLLNRQSATAAAFSDALTAPRVSEDVGSLMAVNSEIPAAQSLRSPSALLRQDLLAQEMTSQMPQGLGQDLPDVSGVPQRPEPTSPALSALRSFYAPQDAARQAEALAATNEPPFDMEAFLGRPEASMAPGMSATAQGMGTEQRDLVRIQPVVQAQTLAERPQLQAGGIAPEQMPKKPVMPEPRKNIEAQLAAIQNPNSRKKAMLVTPGSPLPASLPQGTTSFLTQHGTVITTDPTLKNRLPFDATDKEVGQHILGWSKGRPPVAPNEGVVVRAMDADGVPVSEIHAAPNDVRRAVKIMRAHSPVNRVTIAKVGDVLAERLASAQSDRWAWEQKAEWKGETDDRIVSEVMGRVHPGKLKPEQRKTLASIYGPSIFSRTTRDANGADLNPGQGLDQLAMEENIAQLLPETYGSDGLYTYLVENGRGKTAAAGEWDAQIDAEAARMAEEGAAMAPAGVGFKMQGEAQAEAMPTGPAPVQADAMVGDYELDDVPFHRTDKLGFYSQMGEVLEKPGMLPKAAKTGAEMAAAIGKHQKSGKFKGEELADSGIMDWLASQDGPVTREDVLDEIQARRIEVKEVVKGGDLEKGRAYVDRDEEDGAYRVVMEGNDEIVDAYDTEEAAAQAAARINEERGDTKFGQYQIPGGKNYKELVLTLPTAADKQSERMAAIEEKLRDKNLPEAQVNALQREYKALADGIRSSGAYQSSHWDEPNPVAHARVSERTDVDGKRVLHVEEVQSDWHQVGRKEGYRQKDLRLPDGWEVRESKTQPGAYAVFDENGGQRSGAFREDMGGRDAALESVKNTLANKGVPDAPFKKSWPMLVMKRIMHYAASNGFDRVAWTPGEVQAERYDLSKQVEAISWAKYGDDDLDLYVKELGGKEKRIGKYMVEDLPGVIGKELSEKISLAFNGGEVNGEYTGLDLKIGGEGMAGFYDRILPAEVNKYIGKWGEKVGETTVKSGKTGDEIFEIVLPNGKVVGQYESEKRAQALAEDFEGAVVRNAGFDVPLHSFDITPAMRGAILGGQPLYQKNKSSTTGTSSTTVAAIEKAIKPLLAKLKGIADRVQVVQTYGDLPVGLYAAAKHANMIGGFDAVYWQGDIYIVAEAMTAKEAQARYLKFILGHEGGHHVARMMFPDRAQRQEFFTAIAKLAPDQVAAYLDKHGLKDTEANRIMAAEEVAMDMVGDSLASMKGALKFRMKQFLARLRKLLAQILPERFKEASDQMILDFVAEARAAIRLDGDAVYGVTGDTAYQRAWHGSPVRGITKFDSAFNKTGEGVNAFGWGHYAGERRETGETYRKNVAEARAQERATQLAIDADLHHLTALVDDFMFELAHQNGALAATFSKVRQLEKMALSDGEHREAESYKELREKLQRYVKDGGKIESPTGQLYELEIPEDHELLDWDAPLSKQPEGVREKLVGLLKDLGYLLDRDKGTSKQMAGAFRAMFNQYGGQPNGESLYRALEKIKGSDKAASLYLASIGIPGHRFLDGGSRNKGEGTRNYVIYEDDKIEVLGGMYHRKNGERLAPNGKPSKLNAVQYEQVRTKEFKEWFGDWELASKIRAAAETYRAQLSKAISGKLPSHETLTLGATPNVLAALGAQDLPVVMPQSVISKATIIKHYLNENSLSGLVEAINDPIMVFDSKDGKKKNFVVMTEITDTRGKTVVAAIHVGRRQDQHVVNFIASAYGKDNDGIFESWMKDGLLRYQNTKKSLEWARVRGLQLPKIASIRGNEKILTDNDVVNPVASAVLDENGEPLVVYHGTDADFNTFDKKTVGKVFHADKSGFFFTSTTGVEGASGYAEEAAQRVGGAAAVYPAFLTMKNPLTLGDFAQAYGHETTEDVLDGMSAIGWFDGKKPALLDMAKRLGKDGVLIKDPSTMSENGGAETLAVVFSPNQIKSATGNNGQFSTDNDDIRFHRRQSEPDTVASHGLPPETWFEMIQRVVQDKMNRLVKAVKIIEARTGQALPDHVNAALRETLYSGRTTAAIEDFEKIHVKPLIQAIKDADLTLADVESALYAFHAKRRNMVIAERTKGENLAGSGITNERANEILASLRNDGKMDLLMPVIRRVWNINKARLALLESSGLESAETIQMWKDAYGENYVPLKTGVDAKGNLLKALFGDEGKKPRTGKGYDIRGRESRHATGRHSEAGNILANIMAQYEEAVIRAEKNRVGQSFLRMVEENPDKTLWEVDKTPLKPFFNTKTGEVEVKRDPRYKLADNVLSVKVDGQEHLVTIHDPLLARAMKNMGVEQTGKFMRAMASYNRFLSLINTSLDPEFVISNFLRDIQTAGLNLTAEDKTKLAKQVAKDALSGKTMKGIFLALREKESAKDNEWSQWYEWFRKAGGKIGFFGLNTVEQQGKRLENMLKEAKGDGMALVRKNGREILDFISDVNSSVENAMRLSLFRRAVESEVGVEKAAAMAKELTVNFNKKGEAGSTLNALYLFANASIQGNARILKALMTSKRGAKLTASIAGAAFLLAMFNRAAGGDDDDGQAYWDKIESSIKARNLVIMKWWKDDGSYMSVPLPYGYNVIKNVGDHLEHLAFGDHKPLAAASGILLSFLDAFNPMGQSGTLIGTLLPTITRPFVDIATNKDFGGNPIRPEQAPWDKKPQSQLAWSTVAKPAKAVAEGLNKATGGNEFEPGKVDVSPEDLEHLWNSYTGGVGRFLGRVANLGMNAFQGTTPAVKDVPFARRVMGEQSPYVTPKQFYEAADALKRKEDAYEAYRKENPARAREYWKDNADVLALLPKAKAAEKTLKGLYKERDAIKAKDIPAGEKTRQTEAVDARVASVQKAFLKDYLDDAPASKKDRSKAQGSFILDEARGERARVMDAYKTAVEAGDKAAVDAALEEVKGFNENLAAQKIPVKLIRSKDLVRARKSLRRGPGREERRRERWLEGFEEEDAEE